MLQFNLGYSQMYFIPKEISQTALIKTLERAPDSARKNYLHKILSIREKAKQNYSARAYFRKIMMLFRCLIPGFDSPSVYKAKTV